MLILPRRVLGHKGDLLNLLSTIADRQYKHQRRTVKLRGSRLLQVAVTESGVGEISEHEGAQNLHQFPSLCSQDRGSQPVAGSLEISTAAALFRPGSAAE